MAADVRGGAAATRRDERALNVDGTTAELAALAGSRTVTLAAIDADARLDRRAPATTSGARG